MLTLILYGINHTDYLSEAVTIEELSVYNHKKLIPTCKSPHILVFTLLLDDSIKEALAESIQICTRHFYP